MIKKNYKLDIFLLIIFIVFIFSSTIFATSDNGNTGLKFLGFSKDGNKIAFVEFVEHYKMFNICEGHQYHREYLDTYVLDIATGKKHLYCKGLTSLFNNQTGGRFDRSDFLPYCCEDYRQKYYDKCESLKKRFKFDSKKYQGEIYFNNSLIFKSKADIQLQFLSIFNDFNLVVIHIRLWNSGEFIEQLLLYDISKNELKSLTNTAYLLEKVLSAESDEDFWLTNH